MVKIYAHRGFSGMYPENSMLAFEMAQQAGCAGIETDVQLSADKIPVIFHDTSLERTINQPGLVCDYTYDQLRKMDIGKGERMITLRECLTFCLEHNFEVNLELKNYDVFYPGMEKMVIDMVRELKAEDLVILSSFNHYSMALCKEIDPEIKTGLLYEYQLYKPELLLDITKADALHPQVKCLLFDKKLVSTVHNKGKLIHTWVCNDVDEMKVLYEMGANIIMTDYPDRMMEAVKQFG